MSEVAQPSVSRRAVFLVGGYERNDAAGFFRRIGREMEPFLDRIEDGATARVDCPCRDLFRSRAPGDTPLNLRVGKSRGDP